MKFLQGGDLALECRVREHHARKSKCMGRDFARIG